MEVGRNRGSWGGWGGGGSSRADARVSSFLVCCRITSLTPEGEIGRLFLTGYISNSFEIASIVLGAKLVRFFLWNSLFQFLKGVILF